MKIFRPLLTVPLLLGSLAGSASAQLSLDFTSGVLGASVEFALEGQAGEIYLMMPSAQPGPTPLSLVSPGDPRVLSIGIDLINNWSIGVLNGPGNPSRVFYPMPNSPSLAGSILYGQAITLPGPVFFADDISNPVRWVASFRDEFQRTTDDNLRNRQWHTATTLDNGQVLLAGGYDGSVVMPEVLGTWELFDPETQSFVPGGFLPEPRARHTATKLRDGSILLVGGVNPAGIALSSTVLIDATGSLAVPGPPMPALRVHHTAPLLNNDRVLVVGGATRSSVAAPLGFPASFQFQGGLQSHIYDPLIGSWLPGPALAQPRIGHGAALVGDGRCLVAGGLTTGAGGQTLQSTLLYDPTTNQFTPSTPLPRPLAFHAMSPKADGRVWAVGGANIDLGALTVTGSNVSFLYQINPGQPASTAVWTPPLSLGNNGTYIAGDVICIPGGFWPLAGPIIIVDGVIYIVLAGYSSVNLQTGVAIVNDNLHRTDATASQWTNVGSSRSMREGMAPAVFDENLRVLLSGVGLAAGGFTDPRSETWVR